MAEEEPGWNSLPGEALWGWRGVNLGMSDLPGGWGGGGSSGGGGGRRGGCCWGSGGGVGEVEMSWTLSSNEIFLVGLGLVSEDGDEGEEVVLMEELRGLVAGKGGMCGRDRGDGDW